MKRILLTGLLLIASSYSFAQNSTVIPAFIKAAQIYSSDHYDQKNYYTLSLEIRSVIDVFIENQIDPSILKGFELTKNNWTLKEDKYDQWIQNAYENKSIKTIAPIAFQAVKIDVKDSVDFSDDVYAYFFVTDGVVPTGKVTSIYKGVSSGESFFFNPADRALFPMAKVPLKSPSSHLIVDYGIVESDGDDITKMQKLTSIIFDIAIAVYSTQNPANGAMITKLRNEIKTLANLVISQDKDDRIITNTIGLQNDDISKLIDGKTFHDFKKNHKNGKGLFSWEYDVHFRILR